jgi:NAD(P)-dependent dehydrogenase (short-subunit alcohol dehydrogenase family)
MARPAEPSAMAGGVLYLVSGVSRYGTGVALHVNGGLLIT